jgi:hypothetical protein
MAHVPTIRVGKHGNLTFSKRGWPKGFRTNSMKADYAAAKGLPIKGGVGKAKAKSKIAGMKTNTSWIRTRTGWKRGVPSMPSHSKGGTARAGHWVTINGRHVLL